MSAIKKVVLAYSGGLDTSAIVPWLKENYDCEVVAFVADVGQGAEELEGVEEKAIASGASECYVVDLKEQMVAEYIYPTLKTGCVYEGTYLLGTSMARPIIAKAQVEIARKVGADALSHGCTGKGNDQVRFESCFAALAPDLKVIAPWREWHLSSRESLLDYLAQRDIPCAASATKIYSRDANAWHISHEGGELEDPWCQPSEQVWTMTQSPEQAPNEAELVTLTIQRGEVVAVNGEALSPYQCLVKLNDIAAVHGVGRVDIVENRLVGMKSRGCYETPGGTVMMAALQAIDELVLDKASRKWKDTFALEFAHLVYDGRWFTPLKDSILGAANAFAEHANGEVVVKLYKGQAIAVQKQSENSLYSEDFATFGEDDVYDQSHAEGFIRLFSLSSRIAALKK
ncbi:MULTISPECIES: argininosuccinate synthase [Pseudoalteromonas]|mgnify:CR=1 FL=1|uniref:Argininosuccinate synthase n=1 Tax=Pseudoalteromonas ruthenica TaxID=151081 RepID=A0A5S3Z9K7_9GAMM|nr:MULTISPECIES: argininosuccinate synthase [Pseudoalteromonas]MCF2862812.1 argininosuccinate synthase [Pseudoalteromonas sp. CNAT2-18]MCG7543400.1 argininosuccinate synthase [Pseudoalteromonas sp. MM17-2]MCG7558736.1 argininosuccinate synthase [Pseudoalteromonas sp. CNAT2-18.1]TMO48221.1 argininosuccinate synthase [Pseudoalteromonas ruthenica]TMO52024.1 argininosuccinate synthase [Pseudoalteromonas ruthenica]|tara:strand:- start:103434 stop:104633 length:1200 start_codon:yes stop_codon:yes gene_type:complete